MILHVDLNSFFARVEQQANPKLQNRSIGILGKGHKGARTCVCAASPEAKRFGIKSGMSVTEVRRLCPTIILVPPDYPKYLDISRRFMAILESFTPWVEIFSIDEAFLKLNSNIQTNNDIQFSKQRIQEARQVAQEIKQELRQKLGQLITCSIGIAWGKVFAKLAGELEKPDGLVVLEKTTWLERVGELPVGELCGIGRRLAHHLAIQNISTINQLARADAGCLVARFGRSTGMRLWQIGQGIDDALVNPSAKLAPPKSVGHQVTLDNNCRADHLAPMIAKLTKKVGRRLRRSGQAAGQISLLITLSNHQFLHVTGRYQPAISTDSRLLLATRSLFNHLHCVPWLRVRRVSLVAGDLAAAQAQSLPLFPHAVREEQLTKVLDQLRDRYGENVIEWGSAHGTNVGNLRDWRGPRAVLDQ